MERRTKLAVLSKMKDATAASALEAFSARLNSIAEPLHLTPIYRQALGH